MKIFIMQFLLILGDLCTNVASGTKTRSTARRNRSLHKVNEDSEYRATPYLGRTVGCAEVSWANKTYAILRRQASNAAAVLISLGVLMTASPEKAYAQTSGDIYLCTDERGNRTFTNYGDTKRCKKLEVNPITTIPAPKISPSSNAARGPRLDGQAQRERDDTRKQLLEEELKNEQKKLVDLEKEYNNGEPERRGDERNYQKYLDRVQQLKADIDRSRASVNELLKENSQLQNKN